MNGGHQLNSRQKLALDLWYIRRYLPWLDLRILMRTVQMMLFGERIDEAAVRRAELITRG